MIHCVSDMLGNDCIVGDLIEINLRYHTESYQAIGVILYLATKKIVVAITVFQKEYMSKKEECIVTQFSVLNSNFKLLQKL